MDARDLTKLFPEPSAWMKELSQNVQSGPKVNDVIERCAQGMADQVLNRATELAFQEDVTLDILLRNAILSVVRKKPNLLGSAYLACIKGSRSPRAGFSNLKAIIESRLPKVGWWTLIALGVQDNCVFEPMTSLTPLLNLQLRLTTRAQCGKPIRASQVLDDIEFATDLRRNSQGRCLTEFLTHYRIDALASRTRFRSLSLTAQVLLIEYPQHFKQLFGLELVQSWVDTESILFDWQEVRRLSLRASSIESAVRHRKWDGTEADFELATRANHLCPGVLGGLESLLGDPQPLRGDNPSAWGLPGFVAKGLTGLIPPKSDSAELVRLLSTPIDEIISMALHSRRFLNPRPRWIPDLDWDLLRASFTPDQVLRLAKGGRSDLVAKIPPEVISNDPHWAVRQYGDPGLEQEVLGAINSETLIDAVAREFNTGVNRRKITRLIHNLYDSSEFDVPPEN